MDNIPDVSKYCPKLEDIDKTLQEKLIENLTKEEDEFIKATKFILVTATDIEYRAVMGQAMSTRSDKKFLKVIVEDGSANFILGNYGPSKVAIIKTGTGPDETKTIPEPVKKVVKAEYVIAIGVCFGAKESKTKELGNKTNMGDIIIAESIIDTTEKHHEGVKIIVIPETYHCGEKLFNMLRHDDTIETEGKSVKIHHGHLASEESLYRSAKHKEEILGQVPQALGGEMEANGIREVADREKFEWIVIKAIVEWGDEDKNKKWQPFGAVSCARYVLECLTKQPKYPARGMLSIKKEIEGRARGGASGGVAGTTATNDLSNIQDTLKLVLDENFAKLQNATKNAIKSITAQLFSESIIANDVREKAEYKKIIDVFKSNLEQNESREGVQGICGKFLSAWYSKSRRTY